MLAPPPPILLQSAASLDDPTNLSNVCSYQLDRRGSSSVSNSRRRSQALAINNRSNSCYSDSEAYQMQRSTPALGIGGDDHIKHHLVPCAYSKQRRPSRAYLIRQKATGEETILTMTPLQKPVQRAKTTVARVPTFVSSSHPVPKPQSPLPLSALSPSPKPSG